MKIRTLFLYTFLFPFLPTGQVAGKMIGQSPSAVTDVSPSFVVVNEIQSANIDEFVDPSFNFGSWVELYNPTQRNLSLRNLYVSDDTLNLKKSAFISSKPVLRPGEYSLVWFGASNDVPSQVNFQLDTDGGVFYISNRYGKVLIKQNYPMAISRTSYARKVDGGAEWEYTGTPTPEMSNNYSEFSHFRSADPIIDTDSKLFVNPFDVQVTIPSGAELRYTTDGSTPNRNNGIVSSDGRIHVSEKTTVLRFCLFESGKLPSKVVTRSYIYKDRNFNLPIISVVTNNDFLYGDQLGIFVRGTNGKPGNGQPTPCNWNMDWNRPTNVEYFTADGKVVLNQEAHIAVSGGWSRARMPKSFKIKAKKKYEDLNYLPYNVFPSKPYLKHKTWQVRNGGNDSKCRIMDAAFQEIILSSGLDVEGQACQPVVHFINGEYKGMLNLREPNNKDHAYANYGWDDDMLDQFEMSPDSGYCQRAGTEEAFLNWYKYAANAEDPVNYKNICNLVDIDEYINYMAVHMYLGCGDYGANNIKGYRPRVENGKFRFVLYDLDSGLYRNDPFHVFESKQYWTFNYDYDKQQQLHEEIKFVTIFLNMLKNADFRKQFVDTYCLVAGSVFEPQRCTAIIDSLVQQRELALSWEKTSSQESGDYMINNLSNRPTQMIEVLKRYEPMHLSGVSQLNVQLSSNLPQGQITVNELPVPTNRFEGTLFSPVTLKANAPAGYRFVGWKTTGGIAAHQLLDYSSEWQYYDQGSLDGQSWKTNPTGIAWNVGYAPFGYNSKTNNAGFNTIVDYGPNAQDKRPTYYFYKEIDLNTAPQDGDTFVMNYAVDDGIVIYVNGNEVVRYFMPYGDVFYHTYATQYAGIDPNRLKVEIPASYFRKGKNSIAVEVHNCNAPSSDLYFDAALVQNMVASDDNGELVSTQATYELPASGDFNLKACYEEIPEAEQPADAKPVVINEVSAANSIFVNDYFKKRDWVELYNTTSAPIDLAGMYLSDDRTNLHKYQIVADHSKYSTVIEPHGHLVIWVDHMMPLYQLHATFKLASEGGEIFLTAADDSWSDHFIYEHHDEKYSVGRYPDGGNQWYVMSIPTISAPNVLNSYAEAFTQPEYPVGIDELASATPVIDLNYVRQQLVINGQPGSIASVTLYNVTGQCVLQQRVNLSPGTVTLDLPTTLQRGTYIARVNDNLGHQQMIKFIITAR